MRLKLHDRIVASYAKLQVGLNVASDPCFESRMRKMRKVVGFVKSSSPAVGRKRLEEVVKKCREVEVYGGWGSNGVGLQKQLSPLFFFFGSSCASCPQNGEVGKGREEWSELRRKQAQREEGGGWVVVNDRRIVLPWALLRREQKRKKVGG